MQRRIAATLLLLVLLPAVTMQMTSSDVIRSSNETKQAVERAYDDLDAAIVGGIEDPRAWRTRGMLSLLKGLLALEGQAIESHGYELLLGIGMSELPLE